MKRILLSVFAVALTAAWAVPATAGDVTFSGQYRLKGEYVNNDDFTDSTDDSTDMWVHRARLTADANATDDTSVKITIQDTRTFGGTSLLTDSGANHLDLHEAYLNVTDAFGTPVSFRAGRQELSYGDQRLIGAFDWSNNGRAFDGFKFMYSNDAVDVDVFTTTITEDGTATNDDTSFSGVYATIKEIVPNNTVDVYLLNRSFNTTTSASLAAPLGDLYTIGFRVAGAMSGVDYTVEIPYQFGEATTTADYEAWAAAVKVGYTLPIDMQVRIGAEYDFATGQDSSTTEVKAFQSLYPTNHNHFGIGDATTATNTWSNIQAWSINASAQVTEQANIAIAYWDYKEDEPTIAANGDDLGSAVDLVGKYQYNNNLGIEAGVSRFMPGDATTGVGATQDDRDWAYLKLTANF